MSVVVFQFFPFVPYKWLFSIGHKNYPQYHYSVFHAANLARQLNYKAISVFEFGCARGKGLLALEQISKKVKRELNIDVQVYGFDTGEGLPNPKGYKDLTYHWKKGDFRMNKSKLIFKSSTLVLGNIDDTKTDFFSKHKPAPVGAIFFDFDYYSSTKSGMDLLTHKEIN
ncbi:hypothetical protein HOH45_05665 [bacterium]|nr:hypothetical protein [bacterium]